MLADFRGGTALTPSGHVRVTPSLNIQFPGDIIAENMFAIGDIIDWPERHMIIGAKLHADVVFKNLLAALELAEAKKNGRAAAGSQPKRKAYKGIPEIHLIIFGPVSYLAYLPFAFIILSVPLQTGGIVYLPLFWGIMLGDWAARLLKATNLMIPRFRRTMGLAR